MPRSKIIKDIVENNKSISVALQQLLVITNELNNKELNTWIKSELNGYSRKDNLPHYRTNLPNTILYSGINGSFHVTNQPLPLKFFGDYKKEIIDLNSINNSIGEIENYKNSNMCLDLTSFASVIYKNSGISCVNISMKFGNNASERILSNVKTKIIESLLLLEDEFGILDEFCFEEDEISPNKIDKVNEEINSIIFSDGTEYQYV